MYVRENHELSLFIAFHRGFCAINVVSSYSEIDNNALAQVREWMSEVHFDYEFIINCDSHTKFKFAMMKSRDNIQAKRIPRGKRKSENKNSNENYWYCKRDNSSGADWTTEPNKQMKNERKFLHLRQFIKTIVSFDVKWYYYTVLKWNNEKWRKRIKKKEESKKKWKNEKREKEKRGKKFVIRSTILVLPAWPNWDNTTIDLFAVFFLSFHGYVTWSETMNHLFYFLSLSFSMGTTSWDKN